MDINAEREKLIQEYTLMYAKHAKEEENLRKSTSVCIQNASSSVTNARKSPKLTTSSSPSSQSDR